MRRRDFLLTSGLATAGLISATRGAQADGSDDPKQQIFEIRTYHFASPAKREAFETFVAEAAVPAWNRAGAQSVGVFNLFAKDNPDLKLDNNPQELWVFLPHKSAAAAAEFESRLAGDQAFAEAGKAILTAPKTDPAFARYGNMLLRPMTGLPRVVPPPPAQRGADAIYEMRTYESPSLERHFNKLEMFNSGEFAAFERAGMNGVFFGGAIAGPDLPQLTYMVAHGNADDVKKHWSAFGADAEWFKLKADAKYKDNVSKITRRFLRASRGSQI
jgi:hypothetical protein